MNTLELHSLIKLLSSLIFGLASLFDQTELLDIDFERARYVFAVYG